MNRILDFKKLYRLHRVLKHNRSVYTLAIINRTIFKCDQKKHQIFPKIAVNLRYLSKSNIDVGVEEIDYLKFEKVCEETLQSLTEFFEELVESNEKLQSADISYSSGVLTANLGRYGTYVINRQSPNKQIWLSSPISGPKRYDYVLNEEFWVYKHDMKSLHDLLQNELAELLGEQINLSQCLHCKN